MKRADLISWCIHVLATEEAKLKLLNAIGLLSNSAHRDCMSASAHLGSVGNGAAFLATASMPCV